MSAADSTLSPVVFSKKSDEWETPDELFDALSKEFWFTLDAAATNENRKAADYIGPDNEIPFCRDALMARWTTPGAVWLNPPYSRIRPFVQHAIEQAGYGQTVVMLLPARTDTKWFQELLWDKAKDKPRPGIEVRFLKGRLKFKGGEHSAPFPSMVVILYGRKGVR